MINLDDIMDMTGLTHEEIAAVALHEGLPDVSASALGERLMKAHHGPQAARALRAVLRHFVQAHPDAERGASP